MYARRSNSSPFICYVAAISASHAAPPSTAWSMYVIKSSSYRSTCCAAARSGSHAAPPSTADPCPQESPVVRLTSVVQLQQVQVMPYFPLLLDPCQEECPVVIVLLVQ